MYVLCHKPDYFQLLVGDEFSIEGANFLQSLRAIFDGHQHHAFAILVCQKVHELYSQNGCAIAS